MSIRRNINDIRRNLRGLKREIKEATVNAIEDVTDDLTQKAKELAPLDTGDLRGSGEGKVIKRGNKVRGEVSFNKPYALKQHEELTYNHPRGGQAKYLEQPFRENQGRYKRYIDQKIKEVLR